jgi:predicted NBD/HSP70 family sugar kinase
MSPTTEIDVGGTKVAAGVVDGQPHRRESAVRPLRAHVIVIPVGTGIEAGFVLDSRLYRGWRGSLAISAWSRTGGCAAAETAAAGSNMPAATL